VRALLRCTNLDSLVGLADVTALVEERQHRSAGVPDVADVKQQRGLGESPLLLLLRSGTLGIAAGLATSIEIEVDPEP
jgi:hypothetical protein